VSLQALQDQVVACRKCPRLIAWCEHVASHKRAAYRDDDYWGGPVPGFGDLAARVLIVGLAPGAHGANRTGRMFTGDRSGDWLYRSLHRAEFANQPHSIDRNDGLVLSDAFITAGVRCAPPDNKPTTAEQNTCRAYLQQELTLMPQLRVIIALGGLAWNSLFRALAAVDLHDSPRPKFGHGAEVSVGPYLVIGCYHPSQQNTFTGRLTEPMLDAVLLRARDIIQPRI